MLVKLDACTATHKGDRQYQQDQFLFMRHPLFPSLFIAAVADGMGGSTGGREAAEQVVFTVKNHFEEFRPKSETPQELIENIIKDSHRMIRAARFMADAEPHSTVVVLLIHNDEATWGHAGDSRLFYFHQNRLKAVTEDHSLVQELIRQGRITEEQALVHPQRSILLSCLGAATEPVITIHPTVKIVPGDKFILCSDGIWGQFTNAEIEQDYAHTEPKPSGITLFKKARERAGGHGDNLTIILLKVVDFILDEADQMRDFQDFFSETPSTPKKASATLNLGLT